jgi:hypothetical protein
MSNIPLTILSKIKNEDFNISAHCFWNGIRVRYVLTTFSEKFKILKSNYLTLKNLNVKKNRLMVLSL